jgi:hypothetical protein
MQSSPNECNGSEDGTTQGSRYSYKATGVRNPRPEFFVARYIDKRRAHDDGSEMRMRFLKLHQLRFRFSLDAAEKRCEVARLLPRHAVSRDEDKVEGFRLWLDIFECLGSFES